MVREEENFQEEAEEAINSLYDDEAEAEAEATRVLVPAEEETTQLLDAVEADSAAEYAQDSEDTTQLFEPIGAAATVRPIAQGPTDTVQHTFEKNEGRVRHKVAAAIISILVLFGIGLGAGLYTSHLRSERETQALLEENERRAAEAAEAAAAAEEAAEHERELEAARAPRNLKFIVTALDYDSLSTRIPLVITGIDAEGNEVQTEGFINAEGEGVALAPGSYTASIPASPIRSNGGMYSVPTATYSFKVPNNEEELITVDQAIVLIPLNTAEVTEDKIDNAYSWAMKDTANTSVAEANAGAARKIIEEEKARKAEEERRKKSQEVRAPLAQSFAEAYFTNVGFPNEDDDSEVLLITNWNAVVSQYVAEGSDALGKLGSGPSGMGYAYATRVSASNISGDTITVDVELVSANEITNGWTLNKSTKHMNCTFNDNNKIADFSIN